MGLYLLRRVLGMVPLLLGATLLVFTLVFVLPGDPIAALAGDRRISPAAANAMRERYHLDQPLPVAYGRYVLDLLQGELGTDFRGRPVGEILRTRVPVTARLAVLALAIEAVAGMGLGLLAAARRGRVADRLASAGTGVLLATPAFVLAVLAQLVFALELGWLPVSGSAAGLRSYVLPAVVLAAGSLAFTARLLREALLESLSSDYVRTAVAKGARPARVIGVHALRNALIPAVTYWAANFGQLMAGAIVVETVFNLPGVGRAVFDAIVRQEGTVVVGIVTFLVGVFLVANLVADVLVGWLDPRIRHG